MQTREEVLNQWLNQILAPQPFTLTPLAGDASFRRYFRLYQQDHTQIVMDAPPDKENLSDFLEVANLLKRSGILVPSCFEQNLEQGFLLLSDFGEQLLFNSLNPENTDASYLDAIRILVQLQTIQADLPPFDAAHIQRELSLFQDWYLQKHLGLSLTDQDYTLLEETFRRITQALTGQPQVFIHRDYHSRNIMRLPDNSLGIIDFQDAMWGPCTYDLVSLLKDCYLHWPEAARDRWLNAFYEQSPHAQQLSHSEFVNAYEMCGLQRHLKVLGIFSRLALRDHKPGYLNDLPLTLHYVMECLANQPELAAFYRFMQEKTPCSKLP